MDADLVRGAQSGDVEAFAGLVERYWARLVAFARSVVGEADAEDAVQDGFVIAWQKLGTLVEPGAFRPWMTRVVARVCYRRAKQRRDLVPLAAVRERSDPGATRSHGMVDVERTLAVLAPRQRAVMHLTVVEGMSDTEIGAALGMAAASVRSHRRRARERLRPVLSAGR